MINRECVFVGDWLRVVVQHPRVSVLQQGNVLWLERLLSPALNACGIKSKVIMPSSDVDDFALQLGNNQIFEDLSDAPERAWARAFDSDAGRHCFSSLFDEVSYASLVVGFEIPPFMKREFSDRGLRYISLHIHPVRFMEDISFCGYSNDFDMASTMASISMDSNDFSRQAARFSARLSRLDPVQGRLPDGIPVLIGQTSVDSSLIFGGKFMAFQDYGPELEVFLRGHDEVAYLKHPLARWDKDVVEFISRDLNKTVLGISGNSYAIIMGSTQIGPMATISSSLGVESRLCGRECHFLLSDPRDKFRTIGLDDSGWNQMDHRLFEPEFWQEIFSGGSGAIPARLNSFHLGANYVRGTLQDSSLVGLEGATPFPRMQKWIIPAVNSSCGRIDEVAGRIAGAGLHDRAAAIAQAAYEDIDLRFAPAPLDDKGAWEWRPAIALPELFLRGFHSVEERGVWSRGRSSVVLIPMREHIDVTLHFEMDVSFFSGILSQGPALLLKVNGRPSAALFQAGSSHSHHHVHWSVSNISGCECEIEIECSHYGRPCDFGPHADDRPLGFMLHSLKVAIE